MRDVLAGQQRAEAKLEGIERSLTGLATSVGQHMGTLFQKLDTIEQRLGAVIKDRPRQNGRPRPAVVR